MAQLQSYTQVYILSAIYDMGDSYFYYPFFFGVLGKKDGPTYLRMLRWLKQKYESIHCPTAVAPLAPTRIYADFEMAHADFFWDTPRGIHIGNWITANNNDLLTLSIVCENKKILSTNFRENSNFRFWPR